jgi:hypothetical protein
MGTSDINLPVTIEQLILLYRANETALQEATVAANQQDLETYRELKHTMIKTWQTYDGADTSELHELAFGDSAGV